MGAGQSKPDDSTKHVFSSETPVQFSQEYVEPGQLAEIRRSLEEDGVNLTHCTDLSTHYKPHPK